MENFKRESSANQTKQLYNEALNNILRGTTNFIKETIKNIKF